MEHATNLIQAQMALAGGAKLPTIGRVANAAEARQVAEELEGVFLSQVLQPMFANVSAEAPFGGGLAEDMWRSLQVEEYGKAMARSGGIGLADAVMREILKLQEITQ